MESWSLVKANLGPPCWAGFLLSHEAEPAKILTQPGHDIRAAARQPGPTVHLLLSRRSQGLHTYRNPYTSAYAIAITVCCHALIRLQKPGLNYPVPTLKLYILGWGLFRITGLYMIYLYLGFKVLSICALRGLSI